MPNNNETFLTAEYKNQTETIIKKINYAINQSVNLKKRINLLYSIFRDSVNSIAMVSDATSSDIHLPFKPPYSSEELNSEKYSLQKDPFLDCHPVALNKQLQLKEAALTQENELLQADFKRIKQILQDRLVMVFNDFQAQLSTMTRSQPQAITYGFGHSVQHNLGSPTAFATPPPLSMSNPHGGEASSTPLSFSDSNSPDSPKRTRMTSPLT